MPNFMIRHHTVLGNKDGLREAVLLAKGWRMSKAYLVNTITQGAYYCTGMERLDMVAEAVGDVL
jgi:hypothetical protein